jgi:hypothetical protein
MTDDVDERGIGVDGNFATKAAYEAHINWKRASCLACGERIVRNRTPHVEIIGTRDGAWIGSWGRTPMTLMATDAGVVPDEDVFELGVVHQACEANVRERLNSRLIELPLRLPKVRMSIGDEVEDETPDRLHLPADANRCPFCDSDTT